MELLLHILIAFSSIIWVTYSFVNPSKTTLHVSYAFVFLTIASGTYLAWSSPAQMLHACMSGLIYVTVISVALSLVRAKVQRLSI